MTSSILTAERLRTLLHYDPLTGMFTRLVSVNKAREGDAAGSRHNEGYLHISVDGRRYLAHRLAFLYVHGRFPAADTDHINGQRDDNRLSNLRETSRSENLQNLRRAKSHSQSGFLGVSWHKAAKQWRAEIRVSGKYVYIGLFPTAQLAHAAYLHTKSTLHPFGTLS